MKFHTFKPVFIAILIFCSTNLVVAAVNEKTRYLPAIHDLLLDTNCEDLPSLANTFYVSPNGNDLNNGRSPQTPWKTLPKVQSNLTSLSPGTQVLFQRGATYRGSLSFNKIHGMSNKKITFGAYCDGAKPVISGLINLKQWQSAGTNKWQITCDSCPEDLNILTHNNKPLGFARYPNVDSVGRGYDYTHQFSINQIVADALAGKSWRGGEVVLRNLNWVLDRIKIEEHIGNTIQFTSVLNENLTYSPGASANSKGYGFFIQNHIDAADLDGEWVWDSNNKEITLHWSVGNPAAFNFEASNQQDVLNIIDSSYLDFTDLVFIGGNDYNVFASKAIDVDFTNVELRSSANAMQIQDRSRNIDLTNLNVVNTTSIGISLDYCYDCTLRNSRITDTGMIAGLATHGSRGHVAIFAVAGFDDNENTVLLEGNTISGTGYIGINFGTRVTARNNIVEDYNAIKTDGGGIYAFNIDGQNKTMIDGNIVRSSAATTAGMVGKKSDVSGESTESYGIYLDGETKNIIVHNNTVLKGGDAALFMNKTAGIDIQYNKLIDSDLYAIYYRDYINDRSGGSLANPGQVIKNNAVIQLNQGSLFRLNSQTSTYDLSGFGDVNNNNYCAPYAQGVFDFYKPDQASTDEYLLDFEEWQDFGFDANSQLCNFTLTNFIETSFGTELVKNGEFTANINNWSRSGGTISHSTELGGALLVNDNGSATSTNPYTELLGNAPNLGETYRISYFAKSISNTHIPLKAQLRNHGAPYNQITKNNIRSISSQGTQHTFYQDIFDIASTSTFRLWFTASSTDLPLILDKVSVRRVQGFYKTEEDLIFVKTNDSNVKQIYTLDANYIDINGKAMNLGTTVTIDPMNTLVLFPI